MSTVTEPACYVIFRQDDKVLFVLREHTGFMDGDYCFPSGRVEAGETYAQGAAREALEEVGLSVVPADLRLVFTQHRRTKSESVETRTDLFFEATKWQGEPVNKEPAVHGAVAWLPVDDLPENIMDYQRQVLLHIAAGKAYGEFGWQVDRTE